MAKGRLTIDGDSGVSPRKNVKKNVYCIWGIIFVSGSADFKNDIVIITKKIMTNGHLTKQNNTNLSLTFILTYNKKCLQAQMPIVAAYFYEREVKRPYAKMLHDK